MLGEDLGTLSSKAVSSIDFLSNLSFIPFDPFFTLRVLLNSDLK